MKPRQDLTELIRKHIKPSYAETDQHIMKLHTWSGFSH